MQKLRCINKPLTQHVSGTTVPIFRSARPYTTANGFQHLMCWLESYDAWRQVVCTAKSSRFPAGGSRRSARRDTRSTNH